MAQYTSLQLVSASNATYFSNVSGQISASAVRDLNVNWISSSAITSGSNTFIGNQIISGNIDVSGTFTASLANGFTFVGNGSGRTQAVSTSSFATLIPAGTVSGSSQITALGFVSSSVTASSLITASFSGNTLTFTKGDSSTFGVVIPDVSGSGPTDISSLNAFTQSQDTKNNTLGIYTGSVDTQFVAVGSSTSSLNSATASLFTSASLALVTASFSGNTLTFTKGNNTTFGVTIPDISGSTIPAGTVSGSSQITALGFVSSSVTGSSLITGSVAGNILTFTKGDGSGFSLTVATGSGGGSTDTGSLMVTGSIAGNILTFTKGDASTFNLTIPSATGSIFDTGSFATTGSNLFRGEQQITSSLDSLTILGYGKRLNFGDNSQQADTARLFLAESDGTNQGTLLSFTGANSGVSFAVNDTATPSTGSTRISFINESRSGSILFQNSVNTNEIKFDNATGSMQLKAGANISISGSSTTIQDVNFLPFSQSLNSRILAVTGSCLITGSVSGNVLTFTKGNASTFTLTVATGSGGGSTDTGSLLVTASFSGNTLTFTKGDATTFSPFGAFATTGSNTFTGAQTLNANSNVVSGSITFNGTSIFNNTASFFNTIKLQNSTVGDLNALRIDIASGSIVLQSAAGAGGISALGHLSASSANSIVNLVFKTGNQAGDTIISGSNNIFTNPSTPTTGYKRYIGGSNNFYLNNSDGINSQITASAASISGARPVMNNNIFFGTSALTINQASNPGTTNTYNNNIFGQTSAITINALAYTGSSFTVNDNIFKGGGAVTINPASASLAEIAAGVSGSGASIEVIRNLLVGGGGMTINIGPKVSSGFGSIISNIVSNGTLTLTNISSSANVTINSNNVIGGQTYSNAGAAGLALHTTAGSMTTNIGAMSLIASASAIQASNNISPSSMAVTNRMFSGSLGVGALIFTNNQTQGASNTYTITGSFGGTGSPTMLANGIFGASNTIFTNVEGRGMYVDFRSNLVGGGNLILTGSNNNAFTASGGGYFGRFNANDGRRNGTGENIFVVGTGGSEATRKTGFLIDSGSNTFVEGSFNVSGSSSLTGSLIVSSFTTLASVSSSLNFADDTAAAAGGVPLGGLYRNGNFVMIRLT